MLLDAQSPGAQPQAMSLGQKVNKAGFRRIMDRESQNSGKACLGDAFFSVMATRAFTETG